jgi:hypothetical protein
MTGFRVLLIVMIAAVTVYTGVTVASHGWNLLQVFFEDIARLAWPGQFDLDFMCMLGLAALWVAWRHGFSATGLGLGVLAFFGGTPFLGLYLLVVSLRAKGGMSEILLGTARAAVRT